MYTLGQHNGWTLSDTDVIYTPDIGISNFDPPTVFADSYSESDHDRPGTSGETTVLPEFHAESTRGNQAKDLGDIAIDVHISMGFYWDTT